MFVFKLVPALASKLCAALHDLDGGRRRHEEVLGVGRAQLVITVQSTHDPIVVWDALNVRIKGCVNYRMIQIITK